MHAMNLFDKTFEHRDALLSAALNEFTARGYDNASINDILTRAGMSKGQFYYHFGNKEALYLALIGVLIEHKQTFLATTMTPADFQQDIFGILKAQVRYGLRFAREYPAINRFAESFLRERSNPIYQTALEHYNFEDNDALGRLLDAAILRGEFRADLPPEFIKRTVGHMLTHAAELAESEQVEDFEPLLDNLIEFMRSGLTDRQS
ncbi:MAG: TetR/AcrR family transcriptional regulator [Chloroflexota bacterium]